VVKPNSKRKKTCDDNLEIDDQNESDEDDHDEHATAPGTIEEDVRKQNYEPPRKKKKKNKDKEIFVNPFLVQTSRKLSNINAKMEKLKQNLKEIKARKEARRLNKEQPVKEQPKSTDVAEQDKAPQSEDFIKVSDTDGPDEKLRGGNKGRKRIFERLADTMTECVSGASPGDDGPSNGKQRKITTPDSVRDTDGSSPSTSQSASLGSSNKPSQKRRRINEDIETTPKLKGIEKRRQQRQEIKAMNKKPEFYKDKDVKNRRQNRR